MNSRLKRTTYLIILAGFILAALNKDRIMERFQKSGRTETKLEKTNVLEKHLNTENGLAEAKTFEKDYNNVKSELQKAQEVIKQLERENKQIADKITESKKRANDLAISDEKRDSSDKVNKLRILCWVMTSANNHVSRSSHVKATWGKRCDILYFVSTKEDQTLPAFSINKPESRMTLWTKTRFGFRYAYENYRDQADWFVKADDDTYMVIENLRHMLEPYKTSDPIWFGCLYNFDARPNGFMQGGAGYVLSRESLERFVTKGLNDPNKYNCKDFSSDMEDAFMGRCLQSVGVVPGDSRDGLGKPRFFPFQPFMYLFPGESPSHPGQGHVYLTEGGLDCCSNRSISFHYITPQEMYALEYLIYQIRTK